MNEPKPEDVMREKKYDRKLSHRIRGYVDDPESTGRLYYGEWGALRPDQRRMIRQLCDECDAFEKAADQLVEHYETIIREKDAEIERLTAYNANLICANTDITNRHKDYLEEAERITRADAITEFADRLKQASYADCTITGYRHFIVDIKDIDQIAKEMKEGSDGSDGVH